MSFPPVVIDTTSSASTTERPVYVYGQSGRCWKFRNAEVADEYFDRLTLKDSCPEFLTDVRYLMNRYGESILKRLGCIAYGDFPIITESNFDVVITYKGKRDNTELDTNPRTYTYYFKNANISITCNKRFSIYSLEPLQYLFPDHKYHRCISYFISNKNELLRDYLLGDCVRYTEPRVQVTAPQRQSSWAFLNIFRRSTVYTPIRVDLHID